MVAIASVTEFEVPGVPSVQLVKGTVTTNGDTYVSKFSTIYNVQCTKYSGGSTIIKTTVSGGTVAVACDSGDVVYLEIWGNR